jgi:hypothetical protein
VIIFGLIFIKKNNQTGFFKKTETEPVQTNRFRFGSVILEQKPVQTDLARVFFVWVWFGFFGFRLIKPKPNRLVF